MPQKVRIARVIAALLVTGGVVGALAGCVDPDDAPLPAASASPALVDGPEGPLPSADDEVVADADSGQPPAVLDEIRTVPLQHVDRVALQFSGSFDGYVVGYVDEVTATVGGKKRTITAEDLGGTALLRITVRNATAGLGPSPAEEGSGFDKPTSSAAGLAQVKDYAVVADSGTELTVAVGVAQRAAFRVLEAAQPARLVVEIARP